MLRAILFSAFLAAPAMAETNLITWGNGSSYIRLQPTKAPGAFAEVIFHNELAPALDSEFHKLELGGFTASVEMAFGRGNLPDEMTVTVPEGFIAVPPVVSVPEGESRVITIYSTEGAGV